MNHYRALSVLLIIFLSAVGVFGDMLIKQATLSSNRTSLLHFGGMAVYAISGIGWFLVMRHEKLEVIAVYYPLFTLLFLVAVGVLFFREHLSVTEIVGVVLAICSILLLARFGE